MRFTVSLWLGGSASTREDQLSASRLSSMGLLSSAKLMTAMESFCSVRYTLSRRFRLSSWVQAATCVSPSPSG